MTETPNQVKPVNDTLDDLLNNPFCNPCRYIDDNPAGRDQCLARTTKASRLIDKLPPERQAQAQELANKIDPTDQQAVITLAQLLKPSWENSLNRC